MQRFRKTTTKQKKNKQANVWEKQFFKCVQDK